MLRNSRSRFDLRARYGLLVRYAPLLALLFGYLLVAQGTGGSGSAAEIDRLGSHSVAALAQQATISGQVIDRTTNQPIAAVAVGAHIASQPPQPTTYGAFTDSQGRYSFAVPFGDWRIGFTTVENGLPYLPQW